MAGALGSLSGVLLGLSALAAGDKVVFPQDWAKGVLYGTVDRYDNKQYRELWATPAAVEAARKGDPIPSGTVLTLIQYKAQLDSGGNPLKGQEGEREGQSHRLLPVPQAACRAGFRDLAREPERHAAR
jgi:hypothetical protein